MNKFSPKFVGPYTIINRIRDKTYIVQHEGSGRRVQVTVQDIRSLN